MKGKEGDTLQNRTFSSYLDIHLGWNLATGGRIQGSQGAGNKLTF